MAWHFSGKQDVYLEIAEKLAEYIRLGIYRDGDRLPSVRQAASEMGVNPNTVARAYACLEERGMIQALPKKGAFVTYGGSQAPDARQETEECRKALLALKEHGVSYEELVALAKEVYLHD